MKWFSEIFSVQSPLNSNIVVKRDFGHWRILVDGAEQSGEAMKELSVHMLKIYRDIRPDSENPSTLLLGLGGGNAIEVLQECWKGCPVIAVEHDPTMIDLARKMRLFRNKPSVSIIEGDAKDTISTLHQKFSLILVDLFTGATPSYLLNDEAFLIALRSHLKDDGVLIINTYKSPSFLNVAKKIYPHFQCEQWRDNSLGFFWSAQ